MKKIFFIPILIAALVFTGCHKDNKTGDGYIGTTVTEEMQTAFTSLYPDVSGVTWARNGNYFVADFTRTDMNVGAEAWFTAAAQWQMTVTDVSFNSVPQAVRDAFNASEYATWRVEDVDMIERTGLETIYVLEVENGNLEYDLYYSAEGILIKAEADTDGNDDSSNYIPGTITETIQAYINTNYPGARIVEIDREYNSIEVDIIHNGVHLELTFSNAEVWQMTVTDMHYNSLPQEVRNAFNTSEYSSWRVEDVEMVERNGMETVYVLEVEHGNNEVELHFSADGTLVNVINDDHGNGSSGQIPEAVTAAINAYISANYPNARIIKTEREDQEIEVKILDGVTERELHFSTTGQWQYTKTEMRRHQLPQDILNAFNASAYAIYLIDDIDFYNTSTENFYIFELDAEPRDIKIKISTSGVIEVVHDN